ncbi:hypothetical protein Cgig2_015064 [Carnegiea gigantea]|uniref:Uncharacterized protein n=1 Tax=Carnegiea gigantea TaxID=171969 RepID=A0A9Q1K5W0_9CARY|nr:hypothetical protein Cgig2_015064 [Carnegiea gigantea]
MVEVDDSHGTDIALEGYDIQGLQEEDLGGALMATDALEKLDKNPRKEQGLVQLSKGAKSVVVGAKFRAHEREHSTLESREAEGCVHGCSKGKAATRILPKAHYKKGEAQSPKPNLLRFAISFFKPIEAGALLPFRHRLRAIQVNLNKRTQPREIEQAHTA